MSNTLTKFGITAALAAGTMMAATPAQARDRYYDRDNDAAIAIGAGVIGLAVGAAIVSNRNDRYYRGYPRGYAYRGYPRGYYYRDYPRRDYYYYDRYPRRDWRAYRNGGWRGYPGYQGGWYGGWGY